MFYCKKCLRLYTQESTLRKVLTREFFCPVHKEEEIFRLTYSDEFCEHPYNSPAYYFNDFIVRQPKQSFIEISNLKPSDLLLLYKMYDFN